jgi:hypothetical protein
LDKRTYELRESLGFEAVHAAENVSPLELPRQRKRRRLIDQAGHEVDVGSAAAKPRAGEIDHVRTMPCDRGDRAGIPDRDRPHVVAGIATRVDAVDVKEIEGDHGDPVQRAAHEVLRRSARPPGEELERVAEGGRARICRFQAREGKP